MMINGYGVVMIVVDMVISNVVASVNGYGVVIGCIIFFFVLKIRKKIRRKKLS